MSVCVYCMLYEKALLQHVISVIKKWLMEINQFDSKNYLADDLQK